MMVLDEAILRAAADIELRARRRLVALLSGHYLSPFRGAGMEFKEFRRYEPGDDLRHISWTVTARTGRPTVKVFDEERELDIVVAVDVSGSAGLGLARRRLDAYADLMALLGLAALYADDKVGFFFFDERPCRFLPPKRTRAQLLGALAQLLSQRLDGRRTELSAPFVALDRLLKHPTLVIVLSDFIAPDFRPALVALGRRHDVVLLHCFSDLERGASLSGVHVIRDPETGESSLLDAGSRRVRGVLANAHAELRRRLEDDCATAGADYHPVNIDEDYVSNVTNYFRARGAFRR
jgi:uncharacterized protein (DUF58 family)